MMCSFFRALRVGVLSLCCATLFAEDAPDFEIGRRVQVTRATPEFFNELAAVAEKKPKITVESEASQETLNALGSLSWLEELEIRSDLVTDLSALKGLTQLKELKLNSMDEAKKTPLSLAPLAAMNALESFNCYASPVTDLDALGNKEQLVEVNLYMGAVNSLDFLSSTPNVEDLDLYGFKHSFEDYKPLLSLTKLKELNIYMNKQAVDEKLKVLEALSSLEKISMSNCKEVTTLNFLANCKNMSEVKAKWCSKLEDASALAGMTQLKRLDLEDSVISDFSFLSKLTSLQSLVLEGTAFTDLSLLPASEKLSSLDLEGCAIDSVEALSTYSNLRRLNLKGTEVQDFSPLYGLKNLNSITLDPSVGEEEKAKLKAAIEHLSIR